MSLSPEQSIRSLEGQAKSINNSYIKNTDFIGKGVDNLVGIFGGETVEKIYTDQIIDVQKQAKTLLKSLHAETLTGQQKVRLESLKDGKLENVGMVQMTKNTDLKQAVVNGAYGVKGEVTGTLHGLKFMITGVFDLAIFMGKYAGSMLGIHPEYKTKINEQATQLFDWIKKEGRIGAQDKVFELIEQEMTRISRLPQEDQAEAIGNIAGNIIGMLTGIKVGVTLTTKSGEMAGKVAQAARITEKLVKRATVNTARMTQVGNLGKQAGYVRMGASVAEKTLNGVAESLIGYGFAKGLSVTWELIRNSTVSVSKKLIAIEKTLVEMEEALKIENNPTQKQSIQEEIRKLREEKVKIQRPDQNLDELKVNTELSPKDRIQKAENLLGGKALSEDQRNIVLHIHENMSKGIFGNNFSDIRNMMNLLQKNGFQSDEIRVLMENGILGFGMRTTSGASNYAIGKLSRIVLPNERLERGGLHGYSDTNAEYSGGSKPDSKEAIENELREQVSRNIQEALRSMRWDGSKIDQDELKFKKTESKIEMKYRLEQERKGGKRDPEKILETAKQNGATLLREGEKLMRANPGISGEELGVIIRKRAEEIGIKITPLQEKILNAQMKKYDEIISKSVFNNMGVIDAKIITFIKDYWNESQTIKNMFNSVIISNYQGTKKIDLLYQSAIYLERIGKLSSITDPDLGELLQLIIKVAHRDNLTEIEKNKVSQYFIQQQPIDELVDKVIPHLGVSIDPVSFPGVIVLKYPREILNGYRNIVRDKGGFNTGDTFNLNTDGFYIRSSRWMHVADNTIDDTIEHEYQHFLNDAFLSPELLGGVIRDATQSTKKQEKKVGRTLDKNSTKNTLWSSMQNELCSYIERNGELPKNIDVYLNSTLQTKLQNGEIPKENILEMERAIQILSNDFNNPNFPREDLVGIIRTSYSMEDMSTRLRKRYFNLNPNDPILTPLKSLKYKRINL